MVYTDGVAGPVETRTFTMSEFLRNRKADGTRAAEKGFAVSKILNTNPQDDDYLFAGAGWLAAGKPATVKKLQAEARRLNCLHSVLSWH